MMAGWAVALVLAVLAGAATRPALAGGATAWVGDARAAVRLIAGRPASDSMHRAGVHLRLAPGWKTYWRMPGDSGIPPQFDFSGSDNVETVTVLWPVPRRLADAEGVTIGYKDGVTFPLRVAARDPGRPALLRMTLDYAICEKLCVPVQAQAELRLSGGDAPEDAHLAAAEARVPQPAAPGDAGAIAILSVQREASASPARILVDVRVPNGAEPELFVEGPTPDWALPVPIPVGGAPAGAQRFAFALDGLPRGASAQGALLTFTASTGAQAIETRYRLD